MRTGMGSCREAAGIMTTAIAVTIAGSDSSGGAGIAADLKTFSALGVYGAAVIAALTAQNTQGVTAVCEVPPDFVAAQMDAVFSDLTVDAVKIGMLGNAGVIAAVAAGLDRHGQTNVVLDPVMAATSGDRLLATDALAALRDELLPRAILVTPNLAEAAALLGEPEASDEAGMLAQADRLLALGANAVLMKGGHTKGAESTDILVTGTAALRVIAERIATRNTHGTGCTLSAAIAAGLARGEGVTEAVSRAKEYVTAAIAAADRLTVGSGPGPLHHFHKWW
jgi:hydroxymethylpyrimidine/phosphomethylpyrimidine kinase